MRTVLWDPEGPAVQMIDQRALPGEFKVNQYSRPEEVASAISDMVVRGAPAIGAAAAFGLALAGFVSTAREEDDFWDDILQAAELLRTARPTAVNLSWALDRVLKAVELQRGEGVDALRRGILEQAQRIADEDIEVNRRIGSFGAALLGDGSTVIHHCNTGALATVDFGTALGVIRSAHESGKKIHVLVDETRPRLQGARLTAWELKRYDIPFEIISDNAAGAFLATKQVDAVLVGADRAAANGDVANKIGTYMLALAAKDNEIPFYVVLPTSTIDLSLPSGDAIPIEERDPEEVLNLQRDGQPIAPEGSRARNPAFDITPHRLITAFVTEVGVIYPPFVANLRKAVKKAQTK